MKRKSFLHLRFFSNIGFNIISMALSVNFMISIPQTIFEKVLYSLFAASLEFAKIYLAIFVKDLVSQFENIQDRIIRLKRIGLLSIIFLAYFGSAAFSAVCSVGYVMFTISKQSEFAKTEIFQNNFEETQITNRLSEISKEISLIQDQMARNLEGYGTANKLFVDAIARLQAEREKLSADYVLLIHESDSTSNEPEPVATDTIFSELGKLFNPVLSGRDVLLRIMLALTILLEVFIFITIEKPVDNNKSILAEDRILIKKYIEKMFDGVSVGRRLRSDYVISREIGVTFDECRRYRDFISKLSWKGTPLLVKTKTSTSSNFSQESLEKIVMFNLDLGRK